MFRAILNFADEISTRPNEVSWKWKGKKSLLACATLYLIYIARLFSLLQHFKFLYRWRSKRKKDASIDKSSTRVNVPPVFDEIYFLIWCLLLFVLPSTLPGEYQTVTKYAAYYFMFESFVWLLYYFFFRRFYEEKYAIMHVLEYIILLPVLIVCQAKCVTIVYSDLAQFGVALASIFFPTLTSTPTPTSTPTSTPIQIQIPPLEQPHPHVYLILISVLYTALIFGILLSNLPVERVKEKGDYRYNMAIIGNGHIVREKLIRAIANTTTLKRIAVFDKTLPNEKEYIEAISKNLPKDEKISVSRHLDPRCTIKIKQAVFDFFPIDGDTEKRILGANVLWIASPPYAHLEYLAHYINQMFIVMEKPVTSNRYELEAVKKLRQSGIWDKVFCLSYYYLEKALPLTFLYNPYPFYEKYIEFISPREVIVSLFCKMGKLRTVSLYLHEGEDNRDWLKTDIYGGHYIETFLHLVVLAKMVTSPDKQWVHDSLLISSRCGHPSCDILYRGITKENKTDILLSMKSLQKRTSKGAMADWNMNMDMLP